MKDKVSLIIPVYNDYKYLKENLFPSLEMQDVEMQIIVVDDASDDKDDLSLYDELKDKIDVYKKFSIHVGANYARNKGFREVTSDYVIFCDADIFFYPHGIDKMMLTIKKYDSDLVYSDFVWSGENGSMIYMKAMEWDLKRLYAENYISFVSLVKTSIANRGVPLDVNVERLQDWDFWLTLARKGHIGKYINEKLFIAVLKSTGISGKGKVDYFKWKQIVQKKHKSLKNAIYK